jgi:multidrug resistance efflux pump
MRGKWLFAVGAVILAGALAGAYFLFRKAPPPAPVAKAPPALPAGTEVRLSGKIEAASVLSIAAPVSGVVEEFAVKPGDEVYEGQILGRISNESLKQNEHEASIEVDRAQAAVAGLESALITARLEDSRVSADATRARLELQRAEKDYQRQSMLNREGATPRRVFERSEQDYQAAKKEFDNLEALSAQMQERVQRTSKEIELAKKTVAEKEEARESAKRSLESANIISPVDGLVLAIRKSSGEQVEQGMPDLVRIGQDLALLQVIVEPEPAILKRIQQGQQVLVETAEVPGEGIPASIKSLADGKVVIEFESPNPLIRPNASAIVKLKLN